MSEKSLEEKIKSDLKKMGHYYIKMHGSMFGKVGLPDIIACIYGNFVAIELKNPNGKGKTSELQKYNIAKINESGGFGVVINRYEDFKKLISSLVPVKK